MAQYDVNARWESGDLVIYAKATGLAIVTFKGDGTVVFGTDTVVTAEIANLAVTAAKLATDAVENAKIKDAAVSLAKMAAASVNAAKLATVANGDVIPGIPVIFPVNIPDGVTGNVDVTITPKIRVIDFHVIKAVAAGGASDTIQLKNGTDAISDALNIEVADKAVVRAASIDDAFSEIAAAGTLRITRTKASANNVACVAYVTGLLVA